MGIEIHGFNLLRYLARTRQLGDVITIGRQSMDVSTDTIREFTGVLLRRPAFCEEVLLAMGAKSVESLDVSSYEDATYIADLNKPYDHPKKYDGVYDFGSLEHIFDVGNAFRNVIGLCKVGGSIVHMLPVNNLNGHGFWQFCSDLMYEIYSEKNGFSGTEVFYASSLDHRHWYKAPLALPGKRVEIASVEPIILLCITTKRFDVDSLDVQQAFYSVAWTDNSKAVLNHSRKSSGRLRQLARTALRKYPVFYRGMRNFWLLFGLSLGRNHYSVSGPQFRKILIHEILT